MIHAGGNKDQKIRYSQISSFIVTDDGFRAPRRYTMLSASSAWIHPFRLFRRRPCAGRLTGRCVSWRCQSRVTDDLELPVDGNEIGQPDGAAVGGNYP
jgi:hypothetical protein